MQQQKFVLEMTLIEPMLGTVPKNKEIYADYIAAKAAKSKSVLEQGLEEFVKEEVSTVPVDEEKGWTGFHTDEEGKPFIYDYLVKGFIKEAGNTLKEDLKVKALKSKIDSYLFVFPRRIYTGPIEPEPFERPLRAMTMQGPRVTLVRSDVIPAGRVLTCSITLLHHNELNETVLRYLLDYGELQGLGQFRNGSFGRFTYKLVPVK